jgi:hypothetical protein
MAYHPTTKILHLKIQDRFFNTYTQEYHVIKVHNQYNKDNIHHQHLLPYPELFNPDESKHATKPTLDLS